jgi:hypothetical protein
MANTHELTQRVWDAVYGHDIEKSKPVYHVMLKGAWGEIDKMLMGMTRGTQALVEQAIGAPNIAGRMKSIAASPQLNELNKVASRIRVIAKVCNMADPVATATTASPLNAVTSLATASRLVQLPLATPRAFVVDPRIPNIQPKIIVMPQKKIAHASLSPLKLVYDNYATIYSDPVLLAATAYAVAPELLSSEDDAAADSEEDGEAVDSE